MDFDKIIDIIRLLFMIALVTLGLFMAVFSSWELIDFSTIKTVGTQQVKCIDKKGLEFVDEYCIKEIKCSRWGIAADKCSEVPHKQEI